PRSPAAPRAARKPPLASLWARRRGDGLIGHTHRRTSELMAAGALVLSFVTAGFLSHPPPALAAGPENSAPQHSVIFDSQETQTVQLTAARTVGDFLKERGITAAAADYIHPSSDTPITGGMEIEYSAAVPVTFVSGQTQREIVSNAADVGALLEERGVHL